MLVFDRDHPADFAWPAASRERMSLVPIDLFAESLAVFRRLEASGVDYAVAGAFAVAFHGVARATTDIDILVDPGQVDAALLAVRTLGFDVPALPMRFADGMEVRRVTKIEADESLTLDFLVAQGPLEEVLRGRIRVETLDGVFSVVSREHLIQMKAWAGRPQDLADIARLRDLDR